MFGEQFPPICISFNSEFAVLAYLKDRFNNTIIGTDTSLCRAYMICNPNCSILTEPNSTATFKVDGTAIFPMTQIMGPFGTPFNISLKGNYASSDPPRNLQPGSRVVQIMPYCLLNQYEGKDVLNNSYCEPCPSTTYCLRTSCRACEPCPPLTTWQHKASYLSPCVDAGQNSSSLVRQGFWVAPDPTSPQQVLPCYWTTSNSVCKGAICYLPPVRDSCQPPCQLTMGSMCERVTAASLVPNATASVSSCYYRGLDGCYECQSDAFQIASAVAFLAGALLAIAFLVFGGPRRLESPYSYRHYVSSGC